MEDRTYKGILTLGIIGLFALAPTAFAQTTSLISVDFTPDPLFGAQGVLPGDKVTGTAAVINETAENQRVIVEAVNVYDADGLGSQLELVISSGGVLYSDTLGNFLRDGGVFLSELSGGQNATYTFEVSFKDSSDNRYQDKSLGFDLCLGFEGGSFNCGDTVIGNEENSDGGETGGGGSVIIPGGDGGGGGNGPIAQTLVIYNERVMTFEENVNQATVEWNTNYLSTSQVVYGLQSNGPYILNQNAPNFGYPMSTSEGSTKVMDHRVVLSGLVPGELYVYRVVSRASPATVSFEHTFVYETDNPFLSSPQSSGQSSVFVGTEEESEVFGDSTERDDSVWVLGEGQGGSNEEEKYLAATYIALGEGQGDRNEEEKYLAAAYVALDEGLFDKSKYLAWTLLLLIAGYLLIRIFFRKENSFSRIK